MTNDTVEILYVEDNPDDALLTETALRDCQTKFHIHHLDDGDAALKFLEQTGNGSVARPDLVLTDLNLPNVSGHDLVQFIQRHDGLRTIPIVVLSGLAYAESALGRYQSAVASILSKPVGGGGYEFLAQQIEEIWLGLSQEPGDE